MVDRTGALFDELLRVMGRLRGEAGCPWDREQTRNSLKPFLVEETYEVLEAIEERTAPALREELGDLLFQVVFHAQIAQELDEFSMADVLRQLIDKMVRRHPHVFGDRAVRNASEALAQWEAIKQEEGTQDGRSRSVLEGVPRRLPALLRAQRTQAKAARVGFDWSDPTAAWEKVKEEFHEVEAAVSHGDPSKTAEELGDLLFALVNVTRLSGGDAEDFLNQATEKFRRRFQEMELLAAAENRPLRDFSLDELNQFWEAVKAHDETGTERP